MTKHTILCVDDETDNVDALERIFRKKYLVLKATSGPEALKILDQHPGPVSVIITDQRMPEMTGVEFLEKTIDKFPHTVKLLLTGYTDLESVIAAVNKGQIFRYLTKPWDPIDLANTVDQAIDRYQVGQELISKNNQLQIAFAELRTLDTAKSNFMILVNHELKTPLTSIINFTSLLHETNLNEEQSLFLDRITQSADRLKNLIEDVLIIIKAENGQLKMNQSLESLRDVIPSLPGKMISDLHQKKITIQENLAGIKVHCDLRLITQVFHRILHNAIKFGRENSTVSISADYKDTHLIQFSIQNEGKSIEPSVLKKITQPFFIDENIMNHSTGTGLGLTVCNVILKGHDSKIEIENTNNGVKIMFELRTE